jgi:proteasome accessory factor C
MLPWLMEVGEAPVADVARRFDMTEEEVQRDLELVAMCGLPPFVDEMIDVFVDDGTVVVGVRRLFTRPLRLTAPEGFSLLAAGRAAMELPGADPTGPLGRGLDKLATALGVPEGGSVDDTAGVAVDLGAPPFADDLAAAVADGAEVDVDYYSPARDEVASRRLVPRHVFVESGNWYVLADDDRSGARRTFRVDRIERVERTGRTVPVDPEATAPTTFFVDADVPRVVLELAEPAWWVIEAYPVDEVTDATSGTRRVRLPVSSERWLARLLLRLGPDARVVDPADGAAPAADMARRILAGYGET